MEDGGVGFVLDGFKLLEFCWNFDIQARGKYSITPMCLVDGGKEFDCQEASR